MLVITGNRNTGKTTQLIYECAKTGFVIVCRDTRECQRIIDYAKDLGLKIPNPISFSQAVNDNQVKDVLIDDIIHFAEHAIKAKVHTITFNGTFGNGNQQNYMMKTESVGKTEDLNNVTKIRQVYEI